MKTIIIILVCFTSTIIFSQSGWEIICYNDNPISPFFKDAVFPNDETGWILNSSHIIKTTNAGVSWKRISFEHSNSTLQCFYFYNESLGWVVENNYLHLTSNEGQNWQILDTTLGNSRSISFRDILTGWICGMDGTLRKTTNGGYNWFNIASGTTDHLNSVSFGDDNNGACAGDWGTILSTTNGGSNWTKFTDPYIGFFSKVRFINSQTGFISGTGNSVYRTTNGGINWISVYINTTQITSVNFNITNTGFAFSSFTDIFRSTDMGGNWNLMPTSGINSRINTSAISQNYMWASADSGIVYRSADFGSNWNEIHRDYLTKENLYSVYFINNSTGYSCGTNGKLIKTINGGVNWNFVSLNTSFNLRAVKFVDNNTGFVCGGNNGSTGVIFKTTNSGINWNITYQDSSHLNSMFFMNSQTGWAAGALGVFLKTTNAGSNWTRNRLFSASTRKIWFVDINTGFSLTGTLNKTTNGGVNWFQALNVLANDFQFIGSTGYLTSIAGGNLLIYKSTNSGSGWQPYLTGLNSGGLIYFIDTETGWISGSSKISKTTNGGVNWTQQTTTNSNYSVNSLHFIDPNYGWGVGSYGSIIRTLTGGIGITTISSEMPKDFNLYQNYPNPFNPSTKLKFQMPKSGIAKLIIYDITGKEIEVILNEYLHPGTYETEWDASNFSSGVYFYSLTTDEFTQTKKMVVVK